MSVSRGWRPRHGLGFGSFIGERRKNCGRNLQKTPARVGGARPLARSSGRNERSGMRTIPSDVAASVAGWSANRGVVVVAAEW